MLLVMALALVQSAVTAQRAVAVTFDDLPVASALPLSDADRETTTARLLTALNRRRVPAIGFVNEGKLTESDGSVVPRRVELLQRWLADGHQLGNHTWSHIDLHKASLAEYEANILRGEVTTKALLARRGMVPRYFRHPYLHTAKTPAIRDSLDRFLAQHGYRVAPVTIDNSDWVFAAAYDRALASGNDTQAAQVREEYLGYMLDVVRFYEDQARTILGREPAQVLLVHANRLNADSFERLAEMLAERGYRFITLDEALEDRAYQSKDAYFGDGGITWLHRWAITAKMPGSTFQGEPEVPGWVQRLATQGRALSY